jgi:hypothetical protein
VRAITRSGNTRGQRIREVNMAHRLGTPAAQVLSVG